jgi:hypothetical protein
MAKKKNPHAVALGRLGGAAGKGISTPKKARAARRNGRLGGAKATSKALLQPCPFCRAAVGARCVTDTGQRKMGFHRGRA